jgi:DNA processing protein
MGNHIHEEWIILSLLQGIGPITISKLLGSFSSPQNILKLKPSEIRSINYLNKQQTESLIKGADPAALKKIIERLEISGIQTLCINDEKYPLALKEISDPPVLLYYLGDLSELEPSAAIVGTRAPSQYGKETAFTLARDLSLKGITIISGLARGIDTSAHAGALEGISKTIAVLGSGLDIIYPKENSKLAQQISLKGALISEFAPGTEPKPENFPKRNRIISGLCSCVIVVEATLNSGAMITARIAAEQGRQCMAVPGMILNPRTKGPHSLIRQGAALIECADDVIAEIAPQLKAILKEDSKDFNHPILKQISASPMNIDEIASCLNMTIQDTMKEVTMLELTGQLKRIDGGRYAIRRSNV